MCNNTIRNGSSLSDALLKIKNMPKRPVIAIAGVTGAVGQEFLNIIHERKIDFSRLKLLASSRSAGKVQSFMGKEYVIEELKNDSFTEVDVALFSAGGTVTKKFAPIAANSGAVVIDNSSAFRMDPDCPLVIPEINPQALYAAKKGIIANPNCSTIIMNMAIFPFHKYVGVDRVVVSTYQASSGAGARAMRELELQAKEYVEAKELTKDIFKRQYIFNLFSHNSDIDLDTGYNEEEIKMINETSKIFNDKSIKVTATCVRVPILRAHCESINLTLKKPITIEKARELLTNCPGIIVEDDRVNNIHPEPIKASFRDEVFIGRLRTDMSQPEGLGLNMFVSSDQIRKGAAGNAIDILQYLLISNK